MPVKQEIYNVKSDLGGCEAQFYFLGPSRAAGRPTDDHIENIWAKIEHDLNGTEISIRTELRKQIKLSEPNLITQRPLSPNHRLLF